MPEPLPETTLAWLRQAAAVDGAAYSQVLLHLLERVGDLAAVQLEQADSTHFRVNALANRLETLEAAQQQQPHQDKLDRHLLGIDNPAPEPAPVATDVELSTDGDSSQRQWYSYDPEEGIEIYSSREQAKSAAESIMGSYQVAAHSDGWHEDRDFLSWGMRIPVEHAQIVARGFNEPSYEIEEWVRSELKTAQPPAAQPSPPAAPALKPTRIITDRYQLGDSIRRAWLTHGQNSWCAIADCVIAELAEAQPAPPAAPAGGLVERVANAIGDGSFGNWLPEARAAIREVAYFLGDLGYRAAKADLLEQVANA